MELFAIELGVTEVVQDDIEAKAGLYVTNKITKLITNRHTKIFLFMQAGIHLIVAQTGYFNYEISTH